MTDRLKGCWVAFDRDIRDDDAEPLIAAIQQMRGVLSVEPSVATPDDWMARERIRHELEAKMYEALREKGR